MALTLNEGHAAGQCVEHKILASDGAANDRFSISVSISGSTGNEVAIIGVSGDDDNGSSSGSAYIYRFDGLTWVEEQKLLASDGAALDNFGVSVSITGSPGNEIAIVGALTDDDNGGASGSAYIYRFNGMNWVEEHKLLAADGAASDLFGISVSLSGDSGNEVVIVGANKDDDNGTDSGSAYIYRFNGVTWVEEQKLLAADGAIGDFFGQSVLISGIPGNEVAIVGAYLDDDNGISSGSAYIFRRSGTSWVQEAKLLASDGAANDEYGRSVSISSTPGNEVAIVGAHLDGDTLDDKDAGSAYIYRFNTDTAGWVEEQKLLASDGAVFDKFGRSVSISGALGYEVAIVGAYLNDDDGFDSGSAYFYRFNTVTAGWVEKQKLLASDGAVDERFGWSVSVSGTPGNEVAIIGASNDDDNGASSGSVYILELTCSGDTDCNGEVNVTDLLLLLGYWGLCPSPCPPDINSDGSVSVTDLLALLAAWGPCSAP